MSCVGPRLLSGQAGATAPGGRRGAQAPRVEPEGCEGESFTTRRDPLRLRRAPRPQEDGPLNDKWPLHPARRLPPTCAAMCRPAAGPAFGTRVRPRVPAAP